MRLGGRCARGNVERGDDANALNRRDGASRTGLVRDDEAGCVHAPRPDRLQPVTEDAVSGFLTDARGCDRMGAGGMTSGKALRELVATPQLMSRRERPDRRERAQGDQRPSACPRTEPLQHLNKGYVYQALSATPFRN
jgi:hypothetical protein